VTPGGGERTCPGIGCFALLQWRFVPASADAHREHASLQDAEVRWRGGEIWGYVQYLVAQKWHFARPLPLPQVEVPQTDVMWPFIVSNCYGEVVLDDSGLTVHEALQPHLQNGQGQTTLQWNDLELVCAFQGPLIIRSVRLSGRCQTTGLIHPAPL
jgi:hypothetical protein